MFGLEFSSHSQRSEIGEEKQIKHMCLRYRNARVIMLLCKAENENTFLRNEDHNKKSVKS